MGMHYQYHEGFGSDLPPKLMQLWQIKACIRGLPLAELLRCGSWSDAKPWRH